MSWVDASASAAATINPISTINAANTINFGNGLITTPTENNVSPTTSTSAVAALGSASDGSGIGESDAGGMSTQDIILWVAGSLVVAVVGGALVYHFRNKL